MSMACKQVRAAIARGNTKRILSIRFESSCRKTNDSRWAVENKQRKQCQGKMYWQQAFFTSANSRNRQELNHTLLLVLFNWAIRNRLAGNSIELSQTGRADEHLWRRAAALLLQNHYERCSLFASVAASGVCQRLVIFFILLQLGTQLNKKKH